MATHRVAIDLVSVREPDKRRLVTVLAWGHPVTVVDDSDPTWIGIRMREGTKFIRRRTRGGSAVLVPFGDLKLLKIDFVDVQQGDGALIETPSGKIIMIDGGATHMFARYCAERLGPTSATSRRPVDAIVITHGDADHFEGLTEIFVSETRPGLAAAKRLFIQPGNVFHNGLIKGPSSLKDAEIFGTQATVDGTTYVTDLADDPRTVADARMNTKFKAWKRALAGWTANGPLTVRRLARGIDDAFAFLGTDDPKVEVLGPIAATVAGAPALPTLGDPAHTINGNSIVLRMTFGKWRLLFAGDLNEPAEQTLATDGTVLRSELFKVPHHGSAEFTPKFLERVAPLVSVISAGDDRKSTEYIHPRATLLGALGKNGRPGGVIFVTELVAFFESAGEVQREGDEEHFFGFRRTAFGIVRVRMTKDRMLVYTDSGKPDMKEAYVFVWQNGQAVRLPDSAVIEA
jgi:hypothetical protein